MHVLFAIRVLQVAGATGANSMKKGKGAIVDTTDRPWMVAIIGGTVATVLGGVISYFVLPQQKSDQAQGAIYCTAPTDGGTCITSRGGQWHVLSAPCPTGQSLQMVTVEARRCQTITPMGFSTPLSVCPAACAR